MHLGKAVMSLIRYVVRCSDSSAVLGSAVICFIIYFVMGFFGAARWGLETDGNLLLNGWGPAGYQGILDILLGIYLALTNPPLVYPVAHVFRVGPSVVPREPEPKTP